jgi:lambda repressor-like predicted transcriptional regulator
MHPADIKATIRKKGLTQERIARQIGVTPMTVSEVINKRLVSDRVMRGIAAALGKDHRVLFSWYYLKPPKRSTSKVCQI